ncbi:Squalene--hopene cyclase [Stieleria maiorica]|uniref:Squalene--hopene cyclase n=1 Tax=Stieleria maiorica TaxID=2795974 RepID=A0A5B9M8F6_9BACT|nr:prenyltransferase/squalene oxidase repeat-containing protein [Stieleria maiorica]QEF96929.1 Squalene--hopene cyclase [Stieleria maiorica]
MVAGRVVAGRMAGHVRDVVIPIYTALPQRTGIVACPLTPIAPKIASEPADSKSLYSVLTTLSPSPAGIDAVRQKCRQTLDRVRGELLAARNDAGHWSGQLAASALSTATAVSAFSAVLLNGDPAEPESLRAMVRQGLSYLGTQQNHDGGFGDTDRSHSNIATSYLVLSASTLAERIGEPPLAPTAVQQLNQYLDRAGRLDGLRKRYGTDKTFVVPIMNNMAIAGLISWDQVAALPFEAAVFPQSMYRFLQMPVVSYAIPALVAIGQARHFLGRRAIAPLRLIRSLCVNRTLAVLERMQPASGGYLEATPLTAFVVMSLAATGRCDLPVVRNGLRFLTQSMLDGGRWPIDTNLATWATSLSIHALVCDPADAGDWYSEQLADWHLGCQHLTRHPFTGAEPGGWGWTDLSGAVPDSDDTPAAILALGLMRPHADAIRQTQMHDAMIRGGRWLIRLQNRNGGWPTFCRGWGKLPFDRSSTDLTAHALRALRAIANGPLPSQPDEFLRSQDERAVSRKRTGHALDPSRPSPWARAQRLMQSPDRSRERGLSVVELDRANRRALRYLSRQQQPDGAWMPLWFGNQDRDDESNPIYGTAKVLIAGGTAPRQEAAACDYLVQNQNADGGWGGGASVAEKIRSLVESDPEFASIAPQIPEGLESSVEETGLAVEALATVILRRRDAPPNVGPQSENENGNLRSDRLAGGFTKQRPECSSADSAAAVNDALVAAILRGVEFLMHSVEDRRHQVAWPIGFYFAKLWYHERLYPLIFTAAALGKVLRVLAEKHDPNWPR